MRQVVLQERRIDVLLDVAHEQDATLTDLAEQHDRHVVDAGATIGWRGGHLAADGPQDTETDLIDVEMVAGREPQPDRCTRSRQVAQPCRVARPRAAHPRLEHPADLVALEQQRETGDVILVGVAEDDGVDPPVPRRDPGIQDDHQAARIGATVDEEAAAARAFDEDGVALSDVQDGDPRDPGRPCDHDRAGDRKAQEQCRDTGPSQQAVGTGRARPRPRRSRGYGPGWRPCRDGRAHRLSDSRAPSGPLPCPPSATPPRHARDPGDRQRSGCGVQRRLECDAGEREARCRVDDRDEQAKDHPAGRRDHGSEDRGRTGNDRDPARQGEHADGHRRRDQWHDEQVDERRQHREPAEGDEDDRQGRRLRSERDSEALGKPARHSPTDETPEPVGERRRPGDQTRRRK